MKLAQSPSTIRRKTRRNVRKVISSPQETSWLQTTLNDINWSTMRYQVVAVLFIMVWIILWSRAVYLQIIIGSDLRSQSSKQHNTTQLVEAKRGNIYDRNGQILARSVEVRSIYAHPHQISDPVYAAKILAPILKSTEAQILKKLQQKRSFVWLTRKVDDATALKIQESRITGIGLSKEYERVYPYKHLAGQLIGFVGLDNQGLEGIERAYDDRLGGTSKKQVVPRNLAGRALYSADDAETDGEDIQLSLDVQIQFIAEEVISEAVETYDAKWGGVLIADPQSGDILAWAQYPFFNPNNFRNYDPAIYRNRLANDALEPGSTFKPLVVAVALEEKIIDTETEFFCEDGVWAIDHIKIGKDKRPFTIGDDGRSYKDLNAEAILMHSSNIGMAKMAQAIGSQKLREYLRELGFGKPVGLGINESRGIIRRLRDWSAADLLSTGFGQSISVTGIQLLQAFNILVNDGERVSLNLLINKQKHNPNATEKNIFSRKNAREVLRMMEAVVDGNGTGKRGRIEGVRVAGKTGTAQKAAKNAIGYGEDRMASFVGIIPADNPRYIVITILDEPKKQSYGGVIAAPVFQKIAVRSMAYSGDLPGVVFAQETDAKINGRNAAQKQAKVKIEKGIVPDVTSLSLRNAMATFRKIGIIPKIVGSGTHIVYQEPAAQTPIYNASSNKKQNDSDKANTKIKQPKSIHIPQEFILYLSIPKSKNILQEIENEIIANKAMDSKEVNSQGTEKNTINQTPNAIKKNSEKSPTEQKGANS